MIEIGPQTLTQTSGVNKDCLVEIIDEAERMRGTGNNPFLEVALDRHVVLEGTDDAVELMCAKCPAMCTVKTIGGNAIALVHDRDECKNKD